MFFPIFYQFIVTDQSVSPQKTESYIVFKIFSIAMQRKMHGSTIELIRKYFSLEIHCTM